MTENGARVEGKKLARQSWTNFLRVYISPPKVVCDEIRERSRGLQVWICHHTTGIVISKLSIQRIHIQDNGKGNNTDAMEDRIKEESRYPYVLNDVISLG